MFSHIATDGIRVWFVLGLLYVHHLFCFTKDTLPNKVGGGLIPSVPVWVETSGGGGGCPLEGSSPVLAQQEERWQRALGLGPCRWWAGHEPTARQWRSLGKNDLAAQVGHGERRHSSGRRWKLLGCGQVWGEGPVLSGGVCMERGDWVSNLLACPEELSFPWFESYELEGSRALKSFEYIGHYEEKEWRVSLKALSVTCIVCILCSLQCIKRNFLKIISSDSPHWI